MSPYEPSVTSNIEYRGNDHRNGIRLVLLKYDSSDDTLSESGDTLAPMPSSVASNAW